MLNCTNMEDEYFKKRIYSINHPGMKQEEMVNGYVDWTKSYEQDLANQAYSAPHNTAITMEKQYTPDIRPNVRILDIGAGTGLVADELQKLGFVHMDALDPIPEMLELARQKGIYENYYEEFLYVDKPTSIPSNTYDCVTAAGCFSENHIPWNVLPELIRLVKPGGLIIIATKLADSDYYKDFDKFVNDLVKDGKLSTADRWKDGLYFKGTNGLTYVLKVT